MNFVINREYFLIQYLLHNDMKVNLGIVYLTKPHQQAQNFFFKYLL